MKPAVKWTLLSVGGLVVLTFGYFAWLGSRVRPDLELGQTLPAATLTDAAGKPIDLAAFKGRPLFLDFWRST
jgi:cytochrome oxidase Cu insertion factor (SCO1/SenC/PrrC family)